MQKVYKVQANDLDERFLEELKATFRDQEVQNNLEEILDSKLYPGEVSELLSEWQA